MACPTRAAPLPWRAPTTWTAPRRSSSSTWLIIKGWTRRVTVFSAKSSRAWTWWTKSRTSRPAAAACTRMYRCRMSQSCPCAAPSERRKKNLFTTENTENTEKRQKREASQRILVIDSDKCFCLCFAFCLFSVFSVFSVVKRFFCTQAVSARSRLGGLEGNNFGEEQLLAVAALIQILHQHLHAWRYLAIGPLHLEVNRHRHWLVEVDHVFAFVVAAQPDRQLPNARRLHADMVGFAADFGEQRRGLYQPSIPTLRMPD